MSDYCCITNVSTEGSFAIFVSVFRYFAVRPAGVPQTAHDLRSARAQS